jgi:outer membrane lipoprotein SlyB
MKALLTVAALGLSALAATTPADAKGCLKGAAVGGAAGHYAHHHGLLGAIAGCVIGRHEAAKHQREQELQQKRQPTNNNSL